MQELGITWFATVAARALHRWPEHPSALLVEESASANAFAREVRHFYPFAPLVGGRSASCDRERANPGRLPRPPRFVRHKPRPLCGPNPIEYVARQDITVSLRPMPTAASGLSSPTQPEVAGAVRSVIGSPIAFRSGVGQGQRGYSQLVITASTTTEEIWRMWST